MSSSKEGRPPRERRNDYTLGQSKYKEGDFESAVYLFTKVRDGEIMRHHVLIIYATRR